MKWSHKACVWLHGVFGGGLQLRHGDADSGYRREPDINKLYVASPL